MVQVQHEPLAPEAASRLIGFARACKGAARAVSLYPSEHPAIAEALLRLSRAADLATVSGPFKVLVLPDGLMVDGRTTARPDAAVSEFAALLHAHMVGQITIQPGVEASAWRTLLGLLGREPVEVRARGGVARALTTAGGIGIEIDELDYAEIIKERSGSEASWDLIIARCLEKESFDLDEKALQVLAEIACDPERLAEFYERTEEHTSHSTKDRCEALLKALRGVASFLGRQDPDRLGAVFENMAAALSHVTPEFLMEMAAIGQDPAHEDSSLVGEILHHVNDATTARFVARNVARQRSCTARMADAFRALAPEPRQRVSAAAMARDELEQMPVGKEAGFDTLWSQVQDILLSHSDRAWVSEDYDQELSTARLHATEMEHVTDDPPERIIGWLRTVSDTSIRAMDLQLLGDLLVVETDGAKRQELLQLVVAQVDELVVLGDFESARRLVEAVSALARGEAPEARAQAARALEHLVGGQLTAQIAVHLNGVREEEFEQVKALCAAVGPALVPRIAEALSNEMRGRARQRLADLLIAFGEHGRQSVDQLLQSPNPGVRRTAIQLLRSFGGPESLPDLEKLVKDTEAAVQREAARALIGFGFDESFEMLKRILADPKHLGRAVVADELRSVRDRKATLLFCYLVRQLECRGHVREIYLGAVERLGVLGGEAAVEALAEVLRRGDWWTPGRTREMRNEAAAALSQIRLPSAQEALRDAATNASFGVRAVARKYVKA